MMLAKSRASTSKSTQPWQLEMFSRSLKKPLKLEALLQMTGDVNGKDCLLITCGDNNGALNWYFKEHGGNWSWGDVSGENFDQISELMEDSVHYLPEDRFQFKDDKFDCIVSIDVLEHLEEDQEFLQEINRVLKPNGLAIVTVPNGDPNLLANRIKWRVGMTPEVYGHTRAGYTAEELSEAISGVGLIPIEQGGYSRFFTEMVELAINYGYVFILSKKGDGTQYDHIAPSSSGELKTHGKAYRLYSLFFPIMRLISKLDRLLPARTNNAVIIAAIKPDEELK